MPSFVVTVREGMLPAAAAVALVLALFAGMVAAAPQATAEEPAAAAETTTEQAVVQPLMAGLVGTGAEHVCAGLHALLDADGSVLGCTHGHDDRPAEAAGGPAAGEVAAAAAAPCYGDGRSGMRVQAIYARASNTADRYASLQGHLREIMNAMTHGLHASTAAAGGGRHVRYVTDGGCNIVIERATVSPEAAQSFSGMAKELRAQGHDDSRRKYLVFADHVSYCGFGSLPIDSNPGIGNAANGRAGSWGMALVGRACFDTVGTGAFAGMHELLHTIGAVAHDAPNSTKQGHCSDGADVMCYSDGSGVPTRAVCPAAKPFRIDCRNDDYLHPQPPSGHRLAGSWNLANSSFLAGSRYANWVDPVAPKLTASPHNGGVALSWEPVPTPYAKNVVVLRDDNVLATLPASARSYDDTSARGGTTYRYELDVVDELGYAARSAATTATRPSQSPIGGSTGGGLLGGSSDGGLLGGLTGDSSGGGDGGLPNPTTPTTTTSSRSAGPDRFATAADVSKKTFAPGVARAYVATGGDFPDALSAGAAAAGAGGPVLLTAATSLPKATEDELRRLAPRDVIVVGGKGAVSDAVIRRIQQATGAAPRRIAGPDRYATAAAIAADAFKATGGTVYVATGLSFPDALAGVPAAATEDAPLLLVSRDAVPPATQQALGSLRPKQVVVLGGSGAVSDAVAARIRQITGASVTRVSGPDRFSTAAAIAARAFPKGAAVSHVATGAGFADALAGGPAAAKRGGPLHLVVRDSLPQPTADSLRRVQPNQLVVLGGEGAVSRNTEKAAAQAASQR